MSNPIIDKTLLQCDKGTQQAPLTVTSQSFAHIAGRFQATEADKSANTNILPFGLCKLKPTSGGYLPCLPALIKWQNTSPFEIDGKKELTTDSFCLCSTGGTVTPLQDEASEFEVIQHNQSKTVIDNTDVILASPQNSPKQYEVEPPNPNVYKTYKGKNYTEAEWVKFEQEQYALYAQKNNLPIDKDKPKIAGRFFLDERDINT